MRCNDRNSAGCGVCGGTGRIKFTDCPLLLLDSDVWETIDYAGLYEKGLPPVAGGALDQAYNFLQAARFVMSEKQNWKNRLGAFE